MHTQLALYESVSPATQLLIDDYQTEIDERRNQLLDDLAIYESRVRDLDELDPLDFTGLGKLYRAHVAQIEELLKGFDDDDAS